MIDTNSQDANDAGFEDAFKEFAAPVSDGPAANTDADPSVNGEENEDGDDLTPELPPAATDAAGTEEQQGSSAKTETADYEHLLESAPPELRAILEAERAAREQAEHHARSANGRVGALQRKINELSKPKDAAPPPPKVRERPEIKHVIEEYGEVVQPLVDIIDSLDDRVSQLGAKHQEDETASFLLQQQEKLTERHPDWMNVARSDDFAKWLPQQPVYVQRVFEENREAIHNADDVADLIGRFKQVSSGGSDQLAQRRARALDASRAPSHRTTGTPSRLPTDDFDANFQAFAAKADQKGRFR